MLLGVGFVGMICLGCFSCSFGGCFVGRSGWCVLVVGWFIGLVLCIC